MDLSKILSISGKPGLYKVVSQAKSAVIVESLIDNKRFPAFGHEKISSLEEISIFTTGEDKSLKEVFKSFHQKLEGKPAPDPKVDNNTLKKFFLEMVPDFDTERVYVSDIRKMVSWYNMLLEKDMLDFTGPEEPQKEETVDTETKAEGETTEPTVSDPNHGK
ncbi:MAG: DUF5606 domain-containing protein [Bacteroidales bacterium]|jgi:hypothetical protein|nr:DUF5606 domain-containing protein [Bacteroidales bacterium]